MIVIVRGMSTFRSMIMADKIVKQQNDRFFHTENGARPKHSKSSRSMLCSALYRLRITDRGIR